MVKKNTIIIIFFLLVHPLLQGCDQDGSEDDTEIDTIQDMDGESTGDIDAVDDTVLEPEGVMDVVIEDPLDMETEIVDDPVEEEDIVGPNPLVGYWVWYQQVENDEVMLTITDEDMLVRIGSGGWPDCPSGIICTHYGIRKFMFDEDGGVFYIHNVHTSSDYEFRGTYSVSGDLVSYTFNEHWSCAHPEINDTEERSGYFRYRLEDGNLWVSVSGFGGHLQFFSDPPEDPQQWVVYRPISQDEFNNRYMIRVCMGTSSECHPDCFPEKYGTPY